MSRFAKLLLALLAATAMLVLWGGTAIADTPTAEQCASETPPADCPAPGDGQAPAGGDGSMGSPPVTPSDTGSGDPAADGSGATPPDDSGQPTVTAQKTDGNRAVVPAYGATADELSDCQGPEDLPDCLPVDCAAFPQNPLCSDPPPACDPEQLTECIPCDDAAFQNLPVCSPPPPCETIEDLPNCTPDCEFVAQLLGQDGCTPPDCIDLSTLPQQVLDAIQQLPQELKDALPICPVDGVGGGDSGGGTPQPPVTQPVDNQPGVFYENCDAAREAGAAPINRGEPGYRSELDRDSDGVACEDDGGVTATPVSDTEQLAYTGTDPKPMLAAGAGLLLLGTGLLRLGRRRS